MDRSNPIRTAASWRRKAAAPSREWSRYRSVALRVVIALPLLACVYAIALYSSSPHGGSGRVAFASRVRFDQVFQAARQPASGVRSPRLIYQYSVVPGGVQDVAELSQAVAHDPEVALHYASFNFHRAHLVRLPADQKMYISYRRHGRILWTKIPHLILAGEKVITDGKVTARVRCGNRLASKPEGLTAPDEPTEAQLNQPVAVAGDPVRPPAVLANRSPLVPPLVANGPVAGPVGIPIGIGPIIGGGGGGAGCETVAQEAAEHDHDKGEIICPPTHHEPPPPVPVPEPGTLLMVGTGILALAYAIRAKRTRHLPRHLPH